MFERFTDEARRAVVLAQEEARRLNHNYIGTEHILLGLLRVPDGVAARVLGGLGITADAARGEVEQMIGRGATPPGGHIPFTPRAKKILELSLREALHRADDYIGAEHLLIAVVREGEGVAAQVLVGLGGGLDRVLDAVGAIPPPPRSLTVAGIWFEVPAGDVARAVAFYHQTFGFAARPAAELSGVPQARDEVLDGVLLLNARGRVVGAVVPKAPESAAPNPQARGCTLYLPVGDIAAAVAAAVQAGGVEVSPPRRVAPFGLVALVRDTEGNLIGLQSSARRSDAGTSAAS
jgi:predicted enzyme related to lactoylglutathione lyase